MIEQYPFTTNQAQKLHLTASIGVALHDGHPDYSRIISRTDEALYQAKASDRNTVVIAL
jgi:diguanylate cyclase